MRHKVQDGDIVIAGSDGVYDNLKTDMIISMVNKHFDQNEKIDVYKLADSITTSSNELSKSKDYISPFSEKAK